MPATTLIQNAVRRFPLALEWLHADTTTVLFWRGLCRAPRPRPERGTRSLAGRRLQLLAAPPWTDPAKAVYTSHGHIL